MPKKKRSQLSESTSQARLAKIRRNGESSSENSERLASEREYVSQSRARESSGERSQRLAENRDRLYSLFQMTSFGAKEIREGNFMPTFKVEGQVYHLIGDFQPASAGRLHKAVANKTGVSNKSD